VTSPARCLTCAISGPAIIRNMPLWDVEAEHTVRVAEKFGV
jgi:hypothetical protein